MRISSRTVLAMAGGAAALGFALGTHGARVAAQDYPSLCQLTIDKTASPSIVLLGDEAEIRLSIEAACPTGPSALDVVLVIDQSDSMANGGKLDSAKAAALAFLDEVDLTESRVGIVAFNHVAGLRHELTQDRDSLGSAIRGLRAGGQTNVSAAISLAHDELNRDARGSRQAMIVLTDGYNTAPGAEPIPVAAARAHDDGVTIAAICAGGECDPDLPLAASEASLYYNVPDPAQLPELYRTLAGSLQANGIASMTLRDELPTNMTYVAQSAVPVPSREGSGFLEWDFVGVPPAEIVYRVVPQQVGLHPTNVVATVDFTDLTGRTGSAEFPVPRIRVISTPGCVPGMLEVIFLIDDSNCLYGQSLNDMDARSAIKLGVEGILDQMDMSVDKAAVIGFGDRAITFQTLTKDRRAVLDAVDRISMRDSSARLDYGFQAAGREMNSERHLPESKVVTVIITDGPMMPAPELAELAGQALQRRGVLHYSVGVGFVTQHAVLRTLSEPGGYYEIPFGGDVITPMTQIGKTVVTLTEGCEPTEVATPTPWSPPGADWMIYCPQVITTR